MLEVVNLKARSLDVDCQEISWQIKDTREDVLDYTFQVLRSEATAGPWEALCAAFKDQYVFIDRQVLVFHAARTFHYLLRVTNCVTGAIVDYGPIDTQAEADLVANEIRRHLNLLFREFTGRRCWLLPVRTFGQRCSACWNATLSKRMRSGCVSCFDTGFTRGFHNPIEVWVQIDPGQNLTEQNTNVGAIHQMNTTARVPANILVKPRDVLIEADNRRWRVIGINQTEQVRAPVHYELQMHLIPTSDIEYALELDLGHLLRDLPLSPARNFSNPSNLDSFNQEEIPDVFSLYPTTYTSVIK